MAEQNAYPELRPISDGVLQQFYQEKTITLAAGARIEDFCIYNYFRVLSLSGSGLAVIFGNNQFQTPFTGAGVGLKLDYILPRLTLINTSGVSITLTYAVAVGSVSDDRLNVSGVVTVGGSVSTTTSSVLTTLGDTVVPAAALTLIRNANTTRRGIMFTNVGANVCRIGDSTTTGAAAGAPLLPNQSITLETLDAISCYSTLGTTLSRLEY